MPQPKVYIAAPFIMQAEIRDLCRQLEQELIFVTCRWPWEEKPLGGYTDEFYASRALQDLTEIDAADFVLLIGTVLSRTGGKHFEAGYAVAKGKRLVVIGQRENVFHYLPDVEFVADWEEALQYVKEAKDAPSPLER